MTLIESAAFGVLETAEATPTPDFVTFRDGMERLAGREVSDDDLATFLVEAGACLQGSNAA